MKTKFDFIVYDPDLKLSLDGEIFAKDIKEAEEMIREEYGLALDCFPEDIVITKLEEAANR